VKLDDVMLVCTYNYINRWYKHSIRWHN